VHAEAKMSQKDRIAIFPSRGYLSFISVLFFKIVVSHIAMRILILRHNTFCIQFERVGVSPHLVQYYFKLGFACIMYAFVP
jgi:hypothetical protein